MSWILLAAVGIVVLFFILKQGSYISAENARRLLADGALIIDVRTPREFTGGHVPGAINIPLADLETGVGSRAPDKNRAILLHCLSGGRSAMAASQLKRMGYVSVFNLGSYRRAQLIVAGK